MGARRGRGEEDRRRWISSVINGHDYLAKLAPLCASLFHPFSSPRLTLSLFLSLPPPTSFHLLATSTWGLIIPTRAFSFYTCARLSKLCMGSSHRNNAPAPLPLARVRPLSLLLQLILPLSSLLFFILFRSIVSRPVLVPPNSHYPKQFTRIDRIYNCE